MRKILMVGPILLVAVLLLAACAGPAGPQGQAGPAGPQGPAGLQGPATQNLSIIMGEGEIIQEVNGEEELTGEFHRWEPSVLVVNKGDTVNLTVTNPRSHAHSFILTDFGVVTPRLEGRGGTAEVSFVADKAGTFQFACGLPYDEELGNCGLDHERQVGYLIVLER